MRLTQMIEALLFASDAPLAAADFCRIDERLDEDTVTAVIDELRGEYDREERSFQIYEIAGGYQLLTRPEFASVLERFETVPQSARLSLPALEVLAIITYRQPIGRLEIEEIRGVQCAAVLRTLQDRELIEPVGRSEGVGRPILYATTRKFMEHFGFRSLEDLPRPDELPVVLRPRPLDEAAPAADVLLAAPGAPAEPTPHSIEAAAEAEELHLPLPDELKAALHPEAAPADAAGEGTPAAGGAEAELPADVAAHEHEAASLRD
jgi:segregation and condensation protein B